MENEHLKSFTGTDITAYAFLPYIKDPIRLGSLALFSWGSMRTKSMVTSLGKAKGVGFTRGIRVITGVMVFLETDRSAFSPLYDKKIQDAIAPYGLATVPDEIPPFDLLLTYVNEAGDASMRTVKHIEIVQGQGTNSVDEVNPQESYSFVALEVSALQPLTTIRDKTSKPSTPKRTATPLTFILPQPPPTYTSVDTVINDLIDLL